jgi:hypothetical protein
LRIFLVLRFPYFADDSQIYEDLAANWVRAHIYGLSGAVGSVVPADIRVPGYPAFLALVYLVIGRAQRAIVLAQAFLDLGTCFLVASLAALLHTGQPLWRRRSPVGLAALWLAVSCPLVANYAAVPLTEVLATLFTAAALLAFVSGFLATDCTYFTTKPFPGGRVFFAGGLLTGLGTLVRPETPLLLIALAVVAAARYRHSADWARLMRIGLLSAAGFLLPLAPWAARNWVRFHEIQFVSPRYAATPDETVPRGLYAWTATWLVRFRDVYLVPWNIGTDVVSLQDIPPYAFDSPDERARVSAILDQYNKITCLTPELDAQFAQLARERTARHPLRTYLRVPLERAVTIWLTPRTELLPISGHITPLAGQWREDPVNVAVTLLFGALNFLYVGLAAVGTVRILHARSGAARGTSELPPCLPLMLAFLLIFLLVRTAFLTQVETPEPRYVLECFPVVLALGALCWQRNWLRKSPSAARDES